MFFIKQYIIIYFLKNIQLWKPTVNWNWVLAKSLPRT